MSSNNKECNSHLLGNNIFINRPLSPDTQITNSDGSKFSKDSGIHIDENNNSNDIIRTEDLPMLGNELDNNWKSLGGYSFNELENRMLSKDAAALCQYVYYDDELRPNGDILYHSETHSNNENGNGWISFRSLQKHNKISNVYKTYDGLEPIYKELNKKFPNSKTFLERQRTGFNSDIFFLIKEFKMVLVAYVTEGSRPMSSIKTKNNKPIGGFVDWVGDWLLSDTMQGLTGLSPQHTLAVQNSKKIKAITDKFKIKLMFAGHSLGGGIAVSCAINTGQPAIVFDMAGLHCIRLLKNKKEYDSLLRQHNILSYYIEGELLSTLPWTLLGLKHNGNRYKIAYDNSQSPVEKHGLINICRIFNLNKATRSETDKLINNL